MVWLEVSLFEFIKLVYIAVTLMPIAFPKWSPLRDRWLFIESILKSAD